MSLLRPGGTLWIGDLEPYMDETFLKQAFTLMGENLMTAKIIRNKTNAFTSDGQPLGYGFLEFADEPAALRVLHRCNGKVIPNATTAKRFKLNHASYGKEHLHQRDFSLFVGDLTMDVDDLALYTAFSSRYPSVRSAKVVLDQDGTSKGYGFVRFLDESEYQSALKDMQNALGIGLRPIRVSIATPKNVPFRQLSPTEASPEPDYAAYYQQYYDYQQYYQAWQDYQQQCYNYMYEQSYANYDAQYQQQMQQYYQQGQGYDYADAALEEHSTTVDVNSLNEQIMTRNEDFYQALDNSRWLPTEGIDPPLLPAKT